MLTIKEVIDILRNHGHIHEGNVEDAATALGAYGITPETVVKQDIDGGGAPAVPVTPDSVTPPAQSVPPVAV